MMDLNSDLIPTLLGRAQFPAFKPNFQALQSCSDEDELYGMLLQALEDEPYLHSKVVNRANSLAFLPPGGEYVFKPKDVLSRLGLVETLHVAFEFYLNDALGGMIRANRHCVATWKEARIAAQLSKNLASLCTGDYRNGASFLATALSYVGELFVLGAATTSETTGIDLGFYAQPNQGQVDVFHISEVIIGKLQLPKIVLQQFRKVAEAVRGVQNDFPVNAGTVVLARALAQASQPGGVPVSQVSHDAYYCVVKGLGLTDEQLAPMFENSALARANLDD